MFFFVFNNCFNARAYHEKKQRQCIDIKLRLNTTQIIKKCKTKLNSIDDFVGIVEHFDINYMVSHFFSLYT